MAHFYLVDSFIGTYWISIYLVVSTADSGPDSSFYCRMKTDPLFHLNADPDPDPAPHQSDTGTESGVHRSTDPPQLNF